MPRKILEINLSIILGSMNTELLQAAIMSGNFKIIDNKPGESRKKPIKIILLGDSAVGKSKLVERFLMHRYIPIEMSTYALTLFKYDIEVEGRGALDFDVWDTAGQERFNSMHPAYHHDARACILVFDVTRKVSYKNLEKWLEELRSFRPHIPVIVACNKIDTDPDVVNKAFNFATKNDLPLHYVSAADGTNVVQLFRTALAAAVAYSDSPHADDIDTQVLSLIKEQIAAAQKVQEAKIAGGAGSSAGQDKVQKAQDAKFA